MKVYATLTLLALCAQPAKAATDLLYTGNATTVSPGQVQLQSYYDATFGGPQRVAGASVTYGADPRVDLKLGYGYLWNNTGPDLKLGPNFGVKWRVVGDGLRKPSAAISALYAVDRGASITNHKPDYGALAILQYPCKPMIYLLNYGHVWIGDKPAPDLRYLAFAAVTRVSPAILAGVEYSALTKLADPVRNKVADQYTAAVVYTPSRNLGYSAQFSYVPRSNTHLHLALAVGVRL